MFYNIQGSLLFVFSVVVIVGLAIVSSVATDVDATDVDAWHRSGMTLYTDNETGLQYLSSGICGGLTPRMDANSKQMRMK
ncbi:hypothetical protein UFOVP1299_32 [uncultured Caudovirales phage]|uniref:DUF6440 domain-containing protein n=1 Tax=uncultured Caudovirales phage TaxID=2100421 RepID=A0A6J5RNH2_9CAUD|nr:hypothetical protein UFOVP1299_32 [uncultured Caudovirales phage]